MPKKSGPWASQTPPRGGAGAGFVSRAASLAKPGTPLLFAFGILTMGAGPRSADAVTFNFIAGPGINAQALAGFEAAADTWSALFSDPITVNISIDFVPLGAGILGQANSVRETASYSNFRAAMFADRSSTDDALAYSSLQSGSGFQLAINRTSDSPHGSGSATPYLDADGNANNTTVRMTTANAKALGLRAAADAATDATIQFNSSFSWDFDRGDGIGSGLFDFHGVAAHEIGHALGFTSGVDVLDNNSPPANGPFAAEQFTHVTPLDLFRFSSVSLALGGSGTPDWTADATAKHFSIDGGGSYLGEFATGVNFGDGAQASHWKDGIGAGILDPTGSAGELLLISTLDQRALDVIGYDLASVPELKGTGWIVGLGLVTYAWIRRRGDSKILESRNPL